MDDRLEKNKKIEIYGMFPNQDNVTYTFHMLT